MDFDDYQSRTWSTDQTDRQPWIGLAQSTFGLSEKVGALAGSLKKRIRDRGAYIAFQTDVLDNIGDVLWYLSSVSSHLGIRLEDAAAHNLRKTELRWPKAPDPQSALFSRLLDANFPEQEQLPREFRARFVEHQTHERSWLPMVEVWVGEQRFGDPIDDNSPAADAYRLHDAIHLANAAVLGWSPIVRKLLKRKRRSNPQVDKYDDGARACDAEEALSHLIHCEAKRNNYFDGVSTVDTALLIKIQSIVVDLEVRVRSPAEWQDCILQAYRVFRQLRENHGGFVKVSLLARTIAFDGHGNP